MAAGYDGSITISTNIDTSGFQSDARRLGRTAQSTGNTVSSGISRITGALGKMAVAAAAAFSVTAIVNFSKTCVSAASEMQSALMGLSSIMEGQGRSFSEAQEFINSYTADGLVPATNAINAYKNLALRGYDDSQIQQTMNALKDSAAFGRQASYTLGEAVESATEGLKNENSILVDNAGVTKNVAKMWDEYAASIGTTSNNLTQAQKVQAEVAGILEESKYQAGDAAKATSTYSGQIQQLSASFSNLKIAMGNGIMPIVQAVLPGLNAILTALTKVANLFAQVVSALFGKTATQQKNVASTAVSAAKAENDLAKSTTKAGNTTEKAGKQAKKSLAGFDELNVLADNTADSMSSVADDVGTVADVSAAGGNLGEGYSLDIGEGYSLDIEVPPKVQEFVDGLRERLAELQPYVDRVGDAWENLKGAFENFTSSPGVQKVLEFLAEVWAQLVENALAAALTALSGVINVLAGALNIVCGVLDVVIGLFTGDFGMAANGAKTVVEGLKEIIKGFGQIIESVFVLLLGKDCVETLKSVAKALLETLGNAIGGTENIINSLKTVLNGLSTFVAGVFSGNWKKAWEGIKTVFKGVMDGVYAVAKAAINLVISCINGMINVITKGLNWVISKVNKLSFTVPDWVPGIGGEEFGFNIPKIANPVQIPMLATGAVIPPNSQFLAVLGDQSSGRNLEAPESLIRQIVREETGTGDVYIQAGGDMGQLVRLLKFELKKADRLAGTSLVNGV